MHKPTYCLDITIPAHAYDQALSVLCRLGMSGCEEEHDANGIAIQAYFADETAAKTAGENLGKEAGIPPTVRTIEYQDWNAKWRESMKPARLARGYWVSPLWLSPPDTAKHWIKIEPKMAFGTGHHETTRLAARTLISHKKKLNKKKVLDIGAGSGILCFVAGTCGASFSLGVEIDPYCRENMAENLRNNEVPGRIAFLIGGIDALKRTPLFDLVVMNMLLTESTPLLDTVTALLKPNGLLFWSGILTQEYRQAVETASAFHLSLISDYRENEWWCGIFERSW